MGELVSGAAFGAALVIVLFTLATVAIFLRFLKPIGWIVLVSIMAYLLI